MRQNMPYFGRFQRREGHFKCLLIRMSASYSVRDQGTRRGEKMTRLERENWLISIENSMAYISDEIGNESIDFILGKYGVKSAEQIAPADLPNIFSELYGIEADLRSG